MDEYGEVAVFKNIVFNNGHADIHSLTGRPCLVLSDFNEKLTLLPLTSKDRHKPTHIEICRENYEYGNRTKYKKHFLELDGIIQKNIFYYRPVAQLKLEKYLYILEQLEELQLINNPLCSKYYKEIENDLNEQMDVIKRILKKN